MLNQQTKAVEKAKLKPFLEKVFGKTHIGNYDEPYGLVTIILSDIGLMSSHVRQINEAGWKVIGVHANKKGVLQIGFVEKYIK